MIARNDLKVEFLKLTSDDLGAVDDLMKRNGRTLGFLPTEALIDYLRKGRVLGAKIEGERLVGYLLYAPSQSRFQIVQLCISQEFRGCGIARQLLEELKGVATTQSAITLSCRRDFPAHYMWPKMGLRINRGKAGPFRSWAPFNTLAPHPKPSQSNGLGTVPGTDNR